MDVEAASGAQRQARFPVRQPSDAAPGAVDVVIPVRNGARTILSTLTSVLAQTVAPNRIIVVDDGSTDDTVEIVAGIGSARVEVISTPPRGVSHARNTGIGASRAEFIAFLDADDQWHPDNLRRQLQVFARNPSAAVAYCGYAIVTPAGVWTEVVRPDLSGFIFDELFVGRPAGNSSTTMVRREALARVGGYDETLRFAEDCDLLLHLAHAYEFDFADDILCYVVQNPDSVTRRRPRDDDAEMEILLQYIAVTEKWAHRNRLSGPVARKYRRQIVSVAVRNKRGLGWMLRLRTAMLSRAPVMGRKIWRSHVIFGCDIAVAILAYPMKWLTTRAGHALARRMLAARGSHNSQYRPALGIGRE